MPRDQFSDKFHIPATANKLDHSTYHPYSGNQTTTLGLSEADRHSEHLYTAVVETLGIGGGPRLLLWGGRAVEPLFVGGLGGRPRLWRHIIGAFPGLRT